MRQAREGLGWRGRRSGKGGRLGEHPGLRPHPFSLSPRLLLSSSFFSFPSSPPSCLSFMIPPTKKKNIPNPPALFSTTPLWGGRPKAETGAKHDGMLESSEPWARGADKRPLCPLRKWLSQDPPSPPHWSSRPRGPGLPACTALHCTCSPVLFSSLLFSVSK